MKWIWRAGRLLQLAGLILMPVSLWITEFDRDEGAAIAAFTGSILVFAFGWLVCRLARPRG